MAIHCPRCPLTATFQNLLQLATLSDENKRLPVGELLKHRALPTALVYVYIEFQSPYAFSRIKGEHEPFKRKVLAKELEIAKLTAALSTNHEQHRIDAERLLLAGDVQADPLVRGTAPRPSQDMFQRQPLHVEPVCDMLDTDEGYLPRSALEDGVHYPLPDAGLVSSVAALPVNNILVVDYNSNDVGPLEGLIITPFPSSYHSPSPYHFP